MRVGWFVCVQAKLHFINISWHTNDMWTASWVNQSLPFMHTNHASLKNWPGDKIHSWFQFKHLKGNVCNVFFQGQGQDWQREGVCDTPDKQTDVCVGSWCVCILTDIKVNDGAVKSPVCSPPSECEPHAQHHAASDLIPSVFQPVLHLSRASPCLRVHSPSSHTHSVTPRATYST